MTIKSSTRWEEYSWSAAGKDWRQAKIIAAGVDVGSVSSQAVVFGDDEILCYSNVYTGSSSPDSARRAMDMALDGIGMPVENVHFIVGTGYGRVNVPFASKTVTEITCHARGAHWLFPTARTILDMGGQDCKIIRCDETGRVTEFLMNDKCAAGTGRSMEVLGRLLSVPIHEIGRRSLDITGVPPSVSSTCVIYAKSEALGLLREGVTVRVGVVEDFVISGGIGKNKGVVSRVEKLVGVEARISNEPQIVGAMGAALFARAILEKSARA